MAESNPKTVKCYNCSKGVSEYFELNCKHRLCARCTTKIRSGNRIACPSKKCVKVTQPVPKKNQIKTDKPSRPLTDGVNSVIDAVISKYEKEMRKKENECFQEISKLEKAVTNLRKEEKRQMEDINCVFNMRVKQLEEHYDGLKSQAKHSFQTREGQLEKILTDIKTILENIRDEIKDLHKTLRSESEFSQIEDIQMKTSECANNNIEVFIPDFHMEIQASKEFDICDSIEVEAPPPTFRAQSIEAPVPAFGDASFKECDPEWVSSVQWVHQEHSVKLPYKPFRLRLMPNNELWQCHDGGITMLDAELRPLREIENESESGDMGRVWDVAALPDEDVAVADEYGLFVMDHEGRKRRRIDEGCFTGVAEHDGALYAVDDDIRVYEQAGGWEECRRIDLGCRSQIITISIQDNIIYACICGDAKLLAYSLSGEPVGSYGSVGNGEAGELKGSFLCMTGTGGAVLIADNRNNRLQVLDADRQWSVVSLQPPVRRPTSALLHRGRLLVASESNKMIHVYESK